MTLAEYIARWQLTADGAVVETPSSTLQPVTWRGQPAMLKVSRPESDEHDSAQILLHWGPPAVRVLEHEHGAVLMDRLVPGSSLVEVRDDDAATRIWCDLVRALHRSPPPPSAVTVEELGASFERLCPVHPRIPRDLVEDAAAEYKALCATQSSTRYLLHGDLHHGNILRAGEAWRVIDPKGTAGELAFETGAWLRNPSVDACQPSVVERRVAIFEHELGLDGDRVLRWCFAQGVLSALWSIEDFGATAEVEDSMRVAEAARAVLQTRR